MGLLLLMGGGRPVIVSGPDDTSKAEATTATFSIVARDAERYQWQRSQDGGANFTAIAGATAPSYVTPPLVIKQYNANQFRVVVSNSVGSVTSRAATLTVTGGAGPD